MSSKYNIYFSREKYNNCGVFTFRIQYKSGRKRTNVVKSVDKKFKN